MQTNKSHWWYIPRLHQHVLFLSIFMLLNSQNLWLFTEHLPFCVKLCHGTCKICQERSHELFTIRFSRASLCALVPSFLHENGFFCQYREHKDANCFSSRCFFTRMGAPLVPAQSRWLTSPTSDRVGDDSPPMSMPAISSRTGATGNSLNEIPFAVWLLVLLSETQQ